MADPLMDDQPDQPARTGAAQPGLRDRLRDSAAAMWWERRSTKGRVAVASAVALAGLTVVGVAAGDRGVDPGLPVARAGGLATTTTTVPAPPPLVFEARERTRRDPFAGLPDINPNAGPFVGGDALVVANAVWELRGRGWGVCELLLGADEHGWFFVRESEWAARVAKEGGQDTAPIRFFVNEPCPTFRGPTPEGWWRYPTGIEPTTTTAAPAPLPAAAPAPTPGG